MDFHAEIRQRMIDTMQNSLRSIRQVLGFSVQEFGDIIGLTRQSINNLENGKSRMSAAQFVAVCAVMDHFIESRPDYLSVLTSIVDANDSLNENAVFSNIEGASFLKKWFLCFPADYRIMKIGTDIMRNLAENYKIFLDDTALCEMQEENQIKALLSYMRQYDKRFIIPVLAVDEIQDQLVSEYSDAARRSITMLTMLREQRLAEFRGEKSDVHLTATIKSVFTKFKRLYPLALITQNQQRAKSILSLNEDEEIGGFEIAVFRQNKNGMLQDWKDYFRLQEEESEEILDTEYVAVTGEPEPMLENDVPGLETFTFVTEEQRSQENTDGCDEKIDLLDDELRALLEPDAIRTPLEALHPQVITDDSNEEIVVEVDDNEKDPYHKILTGWEMI